MTPYEKGDTMKNLWNYFSDMLEGYGMILVGVAFMLGAWFQIHVLHRGSRSFTLGIKSMVVSGLLLALCLLYGGYWVKVQLSCSPVAAVFGGLICLAAWLMVIGGASAGLRLCLEKA